MLRATTTTSLALAVVLFGFGVAQGAAGEAGPASSPPGGIAGEEGGCVEHGKINTGDATPVEPGHYEVQTGCSYSRSKRLWDRDGDTQGRALTREHSVSLELAAGVADDFDVGIASSYDWLRDDENDYDDADGELGPRRGSHFGDLGFGARWRFLNLENRSLQMAYIAGFTAPTGSHDTSREMGTSERFWSFDQSLVATKDWGRWTANAEAAFSLPFGEHRDDDRGTLGLNLAAGYQALTWLQPELEVNYEREYERNEYDPETISGTAGVIMPLTGMVSVKAGAQQGLWGRNADKAATLTLAVKLAF